MTETFRPAVGVGVAVSGEARVHRNAVPATRLRVPSLPRGLVRRDRLLDVLDGTARSTAGGRVVLVTGPAGAGKTTLVVDWLVRRTSRTGRSRAWVTASPGDDVHSLWSAIIAAIVEADASPCSDRLAGLDAPRGALTDEVLAAVVDAVESLPEPLCLVIDDVHEIRDPAAIHSIELLLRNLPERMELVLSARYGLERALARLRLDGALTEVDARGLAFTEGEVAQLLESHGVALDDEDAHRLLERTDGWAAGLRLAVPALQRATDPRAFIDDFAGDDRAVSDYLVDEVLAGTAPDVLEILLSTAVCDELSSELAAHLSGREDAGVVLHELERSNGLVVSLEGRGDRYRYHALLREYLLAELRRRGPVRVHAAHAAAARWFAARGSTLDALHHAAEAGDRDLVRALVRDHGLDLVLAGSGARLRRLLARCAARSECGRDEDVDIVESLAALADGDEAGADELLAGVVHGERPGGRDVFWVDLERLARGLAALRRGRIEAAGSLVDAPVMSTDRGLREFAAATAAAVHLAAGDARTAELLLRDVRELAAALHHDFGRLQGSILEAVLASLRCDTGQMLAWSERAIALAAAHGWLRAPSLVQAHLVRGWAGYARMDHETAGGGVSAALALVPDRVDPGTELSARVLAELHRADQEGSRSAALDRLTALWDGSLPGRSWAALRAAAPLAVQRLALTLGRRATADHVLDRAASGLPDAGELEVMRAVRALDRGRPDVSLRHLAPVLAGEVACLVPSTEVSAALVRCLCAVRMGAEGPARDALLRAVATAEPLGLVRPFDDAGPQVREMLDRGASRFGAYEDFVGLLRERIGGRPGDPSLRLTEREIVLLHELPTLSTNAEIAASLSVSVNTVKSHLRSIYRKLGATTRREAVLIARRQGLL